MMNIVAWSVLLIRPHASGDELNFYKLLTLYYKHEIEERSCQVDDD